MEPGLGESELIYTLLNSATNLGAMIGGFLAGFLVRCIPYWYLWLFTLLSHIVGSILYSIGDRSWIILIARLLIGHYAGASLTLSLSYVSTSTETYVKFKSDVNMNNKNHTNKDEVVQLRSIVFAIVSLAFTAGFMIGPGKFIFSVCGFDYTHTCTFHRNGCCVCPVQNRQSIPVHRMV